MSKITFSTQQKKWTFEEHLIIRLFIDADIEFPRDHKENELSKPRNLWAIGYFHKHFLIRRNTAHQLPVWHPIWFPIGIAVPPRNAMLNDSAHRTKPEQLDPRKAKWYKMIDDLREMERENAISLLFRYSVL